MHTQERPTWAEHLKRYAVWFTVGAFIAVGAILFIEQTAAEAADMECTSVECPEVKKKHRKAARKFRNDKTGHSDGFSVKRAFKNPRHARRHFVGKILDVWGVEGSASTASVPAKFLIPDEGDCDTARCSARKEYRHLTSHATCVDLDPVVFPPTTKSCTVKKFRPLYTKKQVKRVGDVAFCGTQVVVGVATRGASRLIAGTGGAYCVWSYWTALW